MHMHCYKNKTGKQFLDFINIVDRKYSIDIKQIFLILDNISIHRSKKVHETIQKYHPRINLRRLPTKSRTKSDKDKLDVDAMTGNKQVYT
ncbi:MAG: hypothetical protein DA328_03230 [Nitrososphaeraceae archaeon]|nr:hypothetical protein [Nitrososphaeraceae archaeon]